MTHSSATNPVFVHQIAQEVFAQLDQCASRCSEAITLFSQARAGLRTHLQRRIRSIEGFPTTALCAVDGTNDCIETTGLTFILLVAVAVDGTTLVAQRTRLLLLPPIAQSDLLASDLRTRLELGLLAEQLRTRSDALYIWDGSITTIYLSLRRLLRRLEEDQRMHRPAWWLAATDLLDRQSICDDWQTILESHQVLAHPKRVTTQHDVHTMGEALQTSLQTDVLLWSVVLEKGEYTLPVPLLREPIWIGEQFWGLSDSLKKQLITGHQRWRVAYAQFASNRPAVRLEFPHKHRHRLQVLLSTIQEHLSIRDILEPVPQYMADALCTSQRRVLPALLNGLNNTLRRRHKADLIGLWLGGWRTP